MLWETYNPNKEQERNDRYRAGFESSTRQQFPEREQERAASTEERPSLKCHKDDVEPKGGKCRSDGWVSLGLFGGKTQPWQD